MEQARRSSRRRALAASPAVANPARPSQPPACTVESGSPASTVSTTTRAPRRAAAAIVAPIESAASSRCGEITTRVSPRAATVRGDAALAMRATVAKRSGDVPDDRVRRRTGRGYSHDRAERPRRQRVVPHGNGHAAALHAGRLDRRRAIPRRRRVRPAELHQLRCSLDSHGGRRWLPVGRGALRG